MKVLISLILFFIIKGARGFIASKNVSSYRNHRQQNLNYFKGRNHAISNREGNIFNRIIKSHIPKIKLSHDEGNLIDNIKITRISRSNFSDILKENVGTIILGGVYGIRILKFLLYIRYLLEWLPQVNPYLAPYDTIYQTTNAYLKIFQNLIPSIAGVDISSIIAWFILENIESYLIQTYNLPA